MASIDLVSASTEPSMDTSVTMISDRPEVPAGSMILSSGRAASETAQEPRSVPIPAVSRCGEAHTLLYD
jgi:hypothetical protein